MKREILFKAVVKYNGNHLFSGDWVYGSLLLKSNRVFIYVIEEDEFGNIVREFEVEVNPETVCQFTGLLDKNGNKIFCGDYCNDTMEKGLIMVVVWDKYLCHFRMDVRVLDEPKKPIKLDGYVNVCDVYDIITEEIIGNIND